jgi:hypothetical protein
LRGIGVPATTNSGGAGKWRPELNEYFAGADIVLLPDNDEPGYRHIEDIGAALTGTAKRIRVVLLPGLPVKGDVCDWIATGGTREQLDALIERAPEWRPLEAAPKAAADQDREFAKAREDELLKKLSEMPPGIEFARLKKEAAHELGVGSPDIEHELRRRRDEKEAAPLHGHWNVEPWPEPADGDSLLRDIIRRIHRHVVCSPEDALTIALWIMLTWVHDEVAIHSPILDVTSAEPESGKSTTLGLISFLTPRCLSSVEISEAALDRAITLWNPCFAIDEFDSVLAGSDDKKALRSVINSGHVRGTGVLRCVGDDNTPQVFPTFCPKAIGMVGRKMPPATLSRCIIVELRRRKSGESIVRFEHKDDPELTDLRSRLFRWAIDNTETLRTTEPSMPDGFDNRRADNWRVQFAIADLCAGPENWGSRARHTATKIEGASDVDSIGVRLLTDIKRIFDEDGCAVILSAVLVEKLKEDPEGPWAEWSHGKGLTQNSLATLLGGGGGRGRGSRGGFGIRSDTVHPSKDVQGKGYKRTQFEDVWARYLTPKPTPPSEGCE